MKYRAALTAPLAAIVVLVGLSSTTMAFPLPSDYRAYPPMPPSAEATAYEDVYHPCHGRTSGTADHACGTRTGGPAGGLF